MKAFTRHSGVAAPLDLVNVDTDMIIPKQFLKTIARTGLSKGLFYEMRYDTNGKMIDDFVMNQPQYADSSVLVTGNNFGCGSSREHAPWALLDWGFRCVIATSFADIFYGNCFNNGILPIALPQADVNKLMTDAHQASRLVIDLATQTVTRPNGEIIRFDIDPTRKKRLLEGVDPIGLTLQYEDDIKAHETMIQSQRGWTLRGARTLSTPDAHHP